VRENGFPRGSRVATHTSSARIAGCLLAVASIFLVTVGSACTNGASSRQAIQFFDGVSVGVPVDRSGDPMMGKGAVATIRITNLGTKTQRIISIEPQSDPGVTLQYVGHSSCKNGCPGAEMYTLDTSRMLARTIEGKYPIIVAPQATPNLIFWITGVNAAASTTLRRTCYVGFKSMLVTFDDGSTALMTAPSYEVSIHLQSSSCISAEVKAHGA